MPADRVLIQQALPLIDVVIDGETVPGIAMIGTFEVTGISGGGGGGDATAANQVLTNTAIGAINETSAPADNSNVGLNGLIKRLNATLSAINAKLPAIGVANVSNSVPVAIASNQAPVPVSGAGGGVQYNEADVDSTITGTALMWEDTSDTLRSVSAAKPLPVNIVTGSTAGTQYLEGDVDPSIQGVALMWEDASDTLRAISATKPLPITIISGASSGTEYTEGQTDATITGAAILWEDASDTLRAVSVAKPLPVVQTGTPGLPTGAATEATLAAQSAKLPAVLGARTIAQAMGVSIASDQIVPTVRNPNNTTAAWSASAVSAAADLGGRTAKGIVLPSAWSTADLSFQGSTDNSRFTTVRKADGNPVSFTAVPADTAVFVPELAPFRYVKLVSSISQTATAQIGSN